MIPSDSSEVMTLNRVSLIQKTSMQNRLNRSFAAVYMSDVCPIDWPIKLQKQHFS